MSNTSNPDSPGAIIGEHRRHLGLSQTELGEEIGVSRWTVIRIERGEYKKLYKQHHLEFIARLGITDLRETYILKAAAESAQAPGPGPGPSESRANGSGSRPRLKLVNGSTQAPPAEDPLIEALLAGIRSGTIAQEHAIEAGKQIQFMRKGSWYSDPKNRRR